jgi:hypothetical protein
MPASPRLGQANYATLARRHRLETEGNAAFYVGAIPRVAQASIDRQFAHLVMSRLKQRALLSHTCRFFRTTRDLRPRRLRLRRADHSCNMRFGLGRLDDGGTSSSTLSGSRTMRQDLVARARAMAASRFGSGRS